MIDFGCVDCGGLIVIGVRCAFVLVGGACVLLWLVGVCVLAWLVVWDLG